VLIGARFASNSIVVRRRSLRARLLAIRTGLTLPREQVDELVAAGEAMIRRHAGAIAGFLEPGAQAAVMARRR
jgi:hypothetical protein